VCCVGGSVCVVVCGVWWGWGGGVGCGGSVCVVGGGEWCGRRRRWNGGGGMWKPARPPSVLPTTSVQNKMARCPRATRARAAGCMRTTERRVASLRAGVSACEACAAASPRARQTMRSARAKCADGEVPCRCCHASHAAFRVPKSHAAMRRDQRRAHDAASAPPSFIAAPADPERRVRLPRLSSPTRPAAPFACPAAAR